MIRRAVDMVLTWYGDQGVVMACVTVVGAVLGLVAVWALFAHAMFSAPNDPEE